MRYTVAIDEEGFPHFDGLRVQDDALLATLLKNLRRDAQLGLVTTCEGETCAIDAFDDPLVVQRIGDLHGEKFDAWFPGGRRETIAFAQLEEDEWHRLHAWIGGDAIPAVLSRKAQADLLNRVKLESLHPRPFRHTEANPSAMDFWAKCYAEGRDGWELNGVHPFYPKFAPALREAVPAGARVLVPGAGRGHEAHWLAEQGYNVTAVDFAPAAQAEFKKRYPASRVTYVTADLFDHLAKNEAAYDAVAEHTIFCAIDPARRQPYLTAVHRSLKPTGHYVGVFWLRSLPAGPPFGLTQWELRERTKFGFDIRAWQRGTDGAPGRIDAELWAIFRKHA